MSLERQMKTGEVYVEFGHTSPEDIAYEKKIEEQRIVCKERCFAYNQTPPSDIARREEILGELLGSAGKGFETVLLVPEGEAYTDQVLLGGVVRPELTAAGRENAEARAQCAARLLQFLLDGETQRDLARAGLFPVTDCGPVYADDE